MKKLAIVAIALAVGVTTAFASSLGVPWFVDTAVEANGVPGAQNGVTGIITLKSNRTDDLVCAITYYNAGGEELGPFAPDNTFVIAPMSSLAFRPVAYDPGTVAGGQENPASGLLVPDRPRSADTDTVIPGTTIIDTKKNGSCVIQWVGGDTDVQGQVSYFQTKDAYTMSYAHLLPPGV